MTAHPARICRYEVQGVLGRGAMGVVYKAHDPSINRQVALKLIRADLLDGDAREDFIARFRQEAQAAGSCSHPNIVTIYDFAVHEKNPFLAMEFIDGVGLDLARADGEAFAPPVAGAIIAAVLDALGAAHERGIVHRDIKPANILLTRDSRVKVTDFGICRFDNVQMTQDGSVIGTPSYMSPEQCRGDRVDARSDLFSTGAVLYELLSGKRPFPGSNFHEVTHRLIHEPPVDIAAINSAVSPAMKATVERALAKRAEDRFANAGEMAAALRAALAGGAAPPAGLEHTIFVPRGMAPPAPHQGPLATGGVPLLGNEALATLERRLAQHVGPIARYLVQSAVRKAGSLDALCDTLAGHIEQASARDLFRKEARRAVGSASGESVGLQSSGLQSSPGLPVLSQDDLGRAEKALTHYLGPVARVLVKRAAAEATSPAAMWERLAAHIEGDADRRTFLANK